MKRDARAAFRALRKHECKDGRPASSDILELAEARGFAAHPSDWLPSGGKHPARYHAWTDWLAKMGCAAHSEHVTPSVRNVRRFKPADLGRAFKGIYRQDRNAAYFLLSQLSEVASADQRYWLLHALGGNPLFNGLYPSDVPIVKQFLKDGSENVREFARKRLRDMAGMETEEANAQDIAWHLELKDDVIAPVSAKHAEARLSVPLMRTSCDELAKAFGLTPVELVQSWPMDHFGKEFWRMVIATGDDETRFEFARRQLDDGVVCDRRLLVGAPRSLWERGLRASSRSESIFSVIEFLGPELGTLDSKSMRNLSAYDMLKPSVHAELDEGRLPVNISWDPLRTLGLAVEKTAASELIDEVLKLGMAPDNPRLTMLKYNLTL